MTDLFRKGTLAYNATLWHEFCHAEKWIKDGTTDGHGIEWNKRLWRKPFLYIADMIYVPLLFAILKKKA